MIPIARPYFDRDELDNVTEAFKSGWISSSGKFILEFEEKFSKYCGMKYGVSTANGTSALHLALVALGIKSGDEVIVPDLTFPSPANAVLYCGAKPISVDAHPDYWGIDPGKIEKAITKKTKAIIPVHLYGHPCDMDPIMKIAKKHKLYVVEDAAEAHGAVYKDKRVGSFGDISCFSFFGNKNMTTGEGGMCLTNSESLKEKMILFRNHGMSQERKYWHEVVGFNYRMTNLQASIGIAQLKKLDGFIRKKKEISNIYKKELSDLEEEGLISLHPKMPWAENVCWIYSILINDSFGISRDEVITKLEERGIDSRPFFHILSKMPPYLKYNKGGKEKNKQKKFPVAESISKRGINLPTSVNLTQDKIDRVAIMIRSLT